MSSVYIVKRKISDDAKGKERFRYHVRWEEPDLEKAPEGKHKKPVHLGAYATRKIAEARQDAVRMQLARGETPTLRIAAVPTSRTFKQLAAAWLETRIDVAANTRRNFEDSIANLNETWKARDPASITVEEVQAWVADHEGAAGTIRLRLGHLSQILTFGDVDPNPVRSAKLRKPRRVRETYWLPNRKELAAMYKKLPAKNEPIVRLMEEAGLRISEAVALRWSDVHTDRGYILVRGTKTNAGTRKVMPVNGLPVIPERPDGASVESRVFPGVTTKSVPDALRQASTKAGIAVVNPHRLRHLCASRLMHDAHLDPAQIAARMGHASPSLTLQVYTHMVPPEDDHS